MDDIMTKMVVREMKYVTGKIERGECKMTNEEGMHFMSFISHEEMTKEQVLLYLRWSRAKFDDYVARGLMPKGKKRSGSSTLYWYRDEINSYLDELS